MTKYSKYKSSGLEWLGDIPEHWELMRLKDCVLVNAKSLGSDTNQELIIKYLDISNVNSTGVTGDIQDLIFNEAPSRARRVLQNNDVIMSTVRPYLKAIAFMSNIPEKMIASTGFAVLTSKFNYNSKYLFYKTVSHWFNETINSKSVGASYPALNKDVLVSTKVLLPPIKEQIAIANYLDAKIKKLDQLVINKKDQIKKLKRIRQIEINNAITKGLDPKIKLKPTGISWLGDIPQHWVLGRFKYIIDFQEGLGLLANEFRESGVPLIRISGVKGDIATKDGCNYVDPKKVENNWAHYKLKKDDILISCSATTGGSSEVMKDLVGSVVYTGIIRLRPKINGITKSFIRYIVGSYYYSIQIELLKTGSTMQHYGPSHLSQMKIVLPKVDEQIEIINYLDNKTSKIDQLVSNIENQIKQLQEIRKIEIYNAVTGKIKVA
jgi:type I restriction enzyme S subunit